MVLVLYCMQKDSIAHHWWSQIPGPVETELSPSLLFKFVLSHNFTIVQCVYILHLNTANLQYANSNHQDTERSSKKLKILKRLGYLEQCHNHCFIFMFQVSFFFMISLNLPLTKIKVVSHFQKKLR